MKKIISLALSLMIAGCAAQKPADPAAVVSGVKLPAHLTIMRPGASVPANLAFWLGEWAGQWNNNLDHVLVVEAVHPGTAKIIYAWGSDSNFGYTPGFERGKAKLTSTELVFKSPSGAVVRYRRQKDGSLAATWDKGQYFSRAEMVRVKLGDRN